jgi:nucleotide-binding universal stress UspA family protein
LPHKEPVFKKILAATGDDAAAVVAAALTVAERSGGAEVDSFHVDTNRPSDVMDRLLQHALDTQADLLVMGAHRHKMASRTAMLSSASVLMVPNTVEFSHILVPIDFSAASGHALRVAQQLSTTARITALAVECDDDPWLDWASDHGRVQALLAEFVQKSGIPGVTCLVEPLRGGAALLQPANRIEGADIAASIVEVAQRHKASIIIMGTRGRTASASVLLGSVTEQVMQQSSSPVLALKEAGSPLNLAEALWSRLRESSPVTAIN